VNSTVPHPVVFAGRPGREVLSANMALCRSSFDEIGLFDERLGAGSKFPGAEDNDLCFRLFEAGYRVLRLPNAAVYHRAWRGRWDYVPLYWGYGRGQGAYFAKHLSLRDRYMLRRLRADVTRHLGRIPRRVRAGMYRDAGGDLAFALGMLTGAAQWLLTERQTRPR
jgi:GT2 family glycosyltransferase